MAGAPCAMEVCDLIIDSQAHPDLVLFSTDNSQVDTMTDVRTADTTGLKECNSAAARAGAAADTSDMLKNRKWLPLALSQNLRFMPLVIESGGRLGDAALGFIERLSCSAGGSPSDRAAFTTYALQRIRALTVKGTAALIPTRPSFRDAPGGIPLRGALPLAASMPRGSCRPFRSQVAPIQSPPPAWVLIFNRPLAPFPRKRALGLTTMAVPRTRPSYQHKNHDKFAA